MTKIIRKLLHQGAKGGGGYVVYIPKAILCEWEANVGHSIVHVEIIPEPEKRRIVIKPYLYAEDEQYDYLHGV